MATEAPIIIMRLKEVRRVPVLEQVVKRQMTQVEGAGGGSSRQLRRLVTRVRQEGAGGLIHRSCGTPSNRRIADRVKQKILRRYAAAYSNCEPTLAAEKLAEREGLAVSDETVRQWLLAEGITHVQRRRRPYRHWRQRRAHRGELVPLDGSLHIRVGGKRLRYHAILARPVRVAPSPRPVLRRRRIAPAADHPWRRAIVRHKGARAVVTTP